MTEQLNHSESQDKEPETSLVAQWLQPQAPNAETQAGFNPWSGNWIPHATAKRSPMSQPRLGATKKTKTKTKS